MQRLDEILKAAGIWPAGMDMSSAAEAEEATDPNVCPICRGVGYVKRRLPLGHPQFGRAVPCTCVDQEDDSEKQARLLRYSNLGHLQRMTFDTLIATGRSADPAHQERFARAVQIAKRFAEQPEGWLAILGRSGSGKTHLAAAIANARIAKGRPALFIVVADLLDHLRSAYRPDAEASYDRLFDQVRSAPLLVLDDLGAQASTPWAQEKLYQIVNHRYNAQLPTVFTSALALGELDERLRTRLADIGQSQVVLLEEGVSRGVSGISALDLPLVQGMTFKSFHPEGMGASPEERSNLGRVMQMCQSFAERPDGWLVLLGDTGVGKTHLAAAIGHRLREQGMSVEFVVVPDLLDKVRSRMSDDSGEDQFNLIDAVRTCSCLILDDLGIHQATPWAQEKLFQILNYRYNAKLPTVITVGRPLEELPHGWVSRMSDSKVGMIFEIVAPDYRGGGMRRPDPPRRRGR